MALVGNTFYQTSSQDPGAGYPMYFWAQTNTGLFYVRNTADNAWVLVGDANQPYLGQLSTQGGTMNGAITGAHGLAPADTNDFTSSLFVLGDAVTTKIYVDAQIAAANAAIATSVASALAQIPALSLSSRVAFESGQWTQAAAGTTAGNVIALPYYTDGVQATAAECLWGVGVSRAAFSLADTPASGATFEVVETSDRVYTITVGVDDASADAKFDWWIVAFRSS